MSPADVDRVFGRGRLKMVTGGHVEVFREESRPGERRRYTKRFLCTSEGDFRQWTEREWRILARLVGHGLRPVPEVVRFDRGASGMPALVQTYDAGVTVDHWLTLLPVERQGRVLRHVFEDCAHWWALARYCLVALDAIHELQLVHLDLKPDNVCIPFGPAEFDPAMRGQVLQLRFEDLALIDFAFSLVSGESLATALPIGHQVEYDYQSPRLLRALDAGRRGDLTLTRELDWRCDMFSLAAMLRRCLPLPEHAGAGAWTSRRQAEAQLLVEHLYDAHHGPAAAQRPHRQLIDMASAALHDSGLTVSLERGWCLAGDTPRAGTDGPTPVTRIALPVVVQAPRSPVFIDAPALDADGAPGALEARLPRRRTAGRALAVTGMVAAAVTSVALLGPGGSVWREGAEPASAGQGVAVAQAAPPAQSALPVPQAEVERMAEPSVAVPSPPAAASAVRVPVPGVAPASAPAPALASAPAPAQARRPATAPARTAAAATLLRPSRVAAARKPELPARAAAVHNKPIRVVAASRGKVTLPKAAPALRSTPAPVVVAAAAAPAASVPEYSAPAAAPAPSPVAPPIESTAKPPAAAPPPAPVATPPVAQIAAPPVAQIAAAPPGLSKAALFLPDDFGARAETVVAEHLPRLAQRAERLVLRALHVAAEDDAGVSDDAVLAVTRTMHLVPDAPLSEIPIASADARRLNAAASAAFWGGRSPQQAIELQLRAFGADPLDAEVAGNLAFYYLKQHPASPELARRLALYALTLPGSRYPHGRLEDWTTYAVASALVGRERDARNALFLTLALTPSLERQCRAVVSAYAAHGAPLRAPAEAMLARIRAWGRSNESPFCRWPPNWWVGMQAP